MLQTWVSIYAESNGAPERIRTELMTLFSATTYQAGRPLTLYIGWQNGRPIATAAIFRAAGTVGIYEVATLPPFRQQGIASTLTHLVLMEVLKEGYEVATLIASTMAEQIYCKLGFTEQCRFMIYN